MASSIEFVEYVCEQINDAGNITYKKMFGEYGIYCNGKIIGVVCDNHFFIKKTEAGMKVCPDCEEAAPYSGAKAHLVTKHLDDRKLMAKMIDETYKELPMPKPKKKSTPSASKSAKAKKTSNDESKLQRMS